VIPILQTDQPEHPEVYKHLSTRLSPRETAHHTTFLTDFEYPTYPAVMKTNTIQIHKSQLESMPPIEQIDVTYNYRSYKPLTPHSSPLDHLSLAPNHKQRAPHYGLLHHFIVVHPIHGIVDGCGTYKTNFMLENNSKENKKTRKQLRTRTTHKEWKEGIQSMRFTILLASKITPAQNP